MIKEFEFISIREHAQQVFIRLFHGDSMPGLVGGLCPGIYGLPVYLMYRCFGDPHLSRVAFQEEIHIVHVAVRAGQIHAGEMTARTEVGQVFQVHADKLETEIPAVEVQVEITVALAAPVFYVFFDTGSYIRRYHRDDPIDLGYGNGRGSFNRFLPPAAGKYHTGVNRQRLSQSSRES